MTVITKDFEGNEYAVVAFTGRNYTEMRVFLGDIEHDLTPVYPRRYGLHVKFNEGKQEVLIDDRLIKNLKTGQIKLIRAARGPEVMETD